MGEMNQSSDNSTQSNVEQQQQTLDWTPHIPKGAEKVFEPLKGKPLADVLNGYAESQRMIGGSIRLPKPDAKPEERDKILNDVFNKLGRPESPDKYDFGELPSSPGFEWDQERLTAVKGALHKAGFTNDQAKAALGLFKDELSRLFPDPTITAAETKAALIKEFGNEQLFNRNLGFAHKAVKEYADPDFAQWLELSGMGNNPNFIKFMSKIGRELVEHGATDPGVDTDFISQADAQKQINEIMNNKQDLYHSKQGTPGREERIQEVLNLHRIANGEV